MSEIASRELRNQTAEVLRITVNGRPVAQLVPIRPDRRRPLTREEMVDLLRTSQADPGLREDLKILAGDTTDDLGPIR
jgi:antitoxin (DNA-binding transcriptional repressor) of toxin-antitoxin stability system